LFDGVGWAEGESLLVLISIATTFVFGDQPYQE